MLDLFTVDRIQTRLKQYLDSEDLFKIYEQQDSGCVSYGYKFNGRPVFIKEAFDEKTAQKLLQTRQFINLIKSDLLAKVHNGFHTAEGYALISEWRPGENLYDYTQFPGAAGRNHPRSPHFRFRQLPLAQKLKVLHQVFDLHVKIEALNYVAVDFYDGCLQYDFSTQQLTVFDLDEYVSGGPFVLEHDRLPGSQRFMAPEEFVRGSLIDHRTQVFRLGRLIVELAMGESGDDQTSNNGQMHEGLDKQAIRKKLLALVNKATAKNPANRFQKVKDLTNEFHLLTTS